jgi:hypothetical protein
MKVLKLIFFICYFASITASAQNKYGQLTVSASPTFSALRGAHKLNFIGYEKSFKFTLGQQLHLDYTVLRRVSFGLGYTHHKHVLYVKDYQYFSGPAIITENPTYIANINSVYFRFLLHHLNLFDDTDKEIDAYWGVQQSITWISSFDNSNDPNFPDNSGYLPQIPSLVVGIRYFPIPQFGIHIEAAIPATYTIAAGVVFKTQGRENILRNKFNWFGLRP